MRRRDIPSKGNRPTVGKSINKGGCKMKSNYELNIKHYLEDNYVVLADKKIARFIKIEFPEFREFVYPINDNYSYAGISAEKLLFISESSLPSIYPRVGPMIHDAKEIVYIKEKRQVTEGLSARETQEIAKELAKLHQRMSVGLN